MYVVDPFMETIRKIDGERLNNLAGRSGGRGGVGGMARAGATRDAASAMGDGGGCWTDGSVAGFTGGIFHYGTDDPDQRGSGALADSHGFGPPVRQDWKVIAWFRRREPVAPRALNS